MRYKMRVSPVINVTSICHAKVQLIMMNLGLITSFQHVLPGSEAVRIPLWH
jgi:hypothetical protein